MIKTIRAAFKTPDLRAKILLTLGLILVYRVGMYIPAPYISYNNIEQCMAISGSNDLLSMMNMFTGGGMLHLSIFALGIMPYITSSIIVQLMRVVIPHFEDLHKEGQSGRARLTEYTRWLTVFLAVLQSTVMVSTANTTLFPGCPTPPYAGSGALDMTLTILVITTGTVVVMWLAELITERGVGNGMSILIFTGIAVSLPGMLGTAARSSNGAASVIIILAVFLSLTLVVTFVEGIQRRIPVTYSKRVVGRKSYGGQSTFIPLKLNMANVIPVIFASSILVLPQTIAQFADPTSGWVAWIMNNFTQTDPLYIVTFVALILFFAFFYTAITFNPDEIADNLQRYGGFVPGIRAGKQTAQYLRYVVSRINWVGALYLAIIALIPQLIFATMGMNNMALGGTSIIIMVGVGLQVIKDIDSQLQQHHYEGFLR